MRRFSKLIMVPGAIVLGGGILAFLLEHRSPPPTVDLKGVVVAGSNNVDKQIPIRDVRVFAGEGTARRDTRSSATGFFDLRLGPQFREGEPIILQFRHPNYMPLDLPLLAGARLIVARMAPLVESAPLPTNLPQNTVSNITIKYSVKTTALLNAGSVVKTFRVVNTGNIPCNGRHPCSPDGRWKATIGSASLEAPRGDVFSDARVSCIAGPCPFTRIDSDGFSQGGPTLRVSILNWSDTATFLFEAEVFRLTISGAVRVSYPVIFGPTLHFTVPSDAEGVYIEADVNRDTIVFPLGPDPHMSWATCTDSINPDKTVVYQCELNSGYTFN